MLSNSCPPERIHKQNVHLIVHGYPGIVLDSPDIFLRFPWNSVYVFLFSPRRKATHKLGGFKKTLLQKHREMIRGRICSEMIRIRARKSELRPESRSYGPKVRVTAGQTPRIRTESPRKGTRNGLRRFYRKPPLKPS